jgi:hypothetical protein
MAFVVMSWSYFLLYFYMGGLARRISDQPPRTTGLANQYIEGVAAYYLALSDTQIALALSVLALTIIAAVRRNRKDSTPGREK